MSDEKTSIAFGPYYLKQSPEPFLGEEVDRATAHKKRGPLVTLYRVLPFAAAVRLCAKYFPDVSLGSHPHFVRVLDIGCRNQIPFLVEERVDGVTLESLLLEGVRLSPTLVAAIAIGVCESLSALFREQDQDVARAWELHPRFIWLTTNGEVKLSLAAVMEKIRAEQLDRRRYDSGPGILVPDFRYFSLERIRGNEQVRSSQFVVGSILCELLGRAPFGEEQGIQTILAMVAKEPEFAPGVPDNLRAILLRAMQKSEDARFERYEAFADALREYLYEASCGYADIGALVRALQKSSNDERVEQEIERLASLRWLRPDAEMEALTTEATDWIEGRLDEHLALTEPYSLGELPCRKLVLSRSCNEVQRLLEEASSETLPEEVFAYIKAQRAARQRAQELCQISPEAFNRAERAAQRGLSAFTVMPQGAPQETKRALQGVFAYRQHETVIEAHLKHIALFGELLASPWEPLLQLWERGVWPLDMLSNGFLIYVPLHRGEVLLTEPNIVSQGEESVEYGGRVNRARVLQ